MQPFKFRLETLLKFRKMQKEQAQIEFVQRTNQYRIEKELLTELKDKLSESINLLRTRQQQSFTVETFKSFQYFIDKVKNDIDKQQDVVVKADEYRQESLRALEETVKKHKVVEKFREKKVQQYQLEAMSEEQKLLDEMGLQIFIREK